jgi:hypothetical protein
MGFERNVLINQLHPDFADIQAARPRQVLGDARLFAASSSPIEMDTKREKAMSELVAKSQEMNLLANHLTHCGDAVPTSSQHHKEA